MVPDRHVGQGRDPVTDPPFQVRPALRIRRLAGFAVPAQHMAPKDEPELGRMTQNRDAVGRQPGEQPGEKLVKDLRPARQQPMCVPTLGHPLAGRTGLWQQVTFDDRHPPVRISQHAGREQPAHAGPQDHRVVTNLRHLRPPR